MEEEFIRQDVDDRICPLVEEPVVIGKHELVEQNKGIVPVESDQHSGDYRKEYRQNSGRFQKAAVSLFPCADSQNQGADQGKDAQDLQDVKNSFYVLKMDPAFS